ncbi:hypothetical protein ACFQMN_03770 [Halobacillus campisalis]|uniref:Uncharacterized protein n=1 Tax=Halobacillus campisalis TaxID=435909 RepID=A0ABW2K1H5_9BACI|nr:hypothetical protein [Halobacillus campisalis]
MKKKVLASILIMSTILPANLAFAQHTPVTVDSKQFHKTTNISAQIDVIIEPDNDEYPDI